MNERRGVVWRSTLRLAGRSRNSRFDLFMALMGPGPTTRVLDVGVTDVDIRSGNFFENRYPWPGQITAVAPERLELFARAHPEVTFTIADGRQLPFPDHSFDIGFSNAVIEHVGSREDQGRFVAEMVRTCRRVFISTPNAGFPVDPHTFLPIVHWLPRWLRERILRITGNEQWATQADLNPLRARDLLKLFPPAQRVRLVRQGVFGLPLVLVAVSEDSGDKPRPSPRRTRPR